MKKIFLIILLISIFTLTLVKPNFKLEASNETTLVLRDDGTSVTYRNSSEKVYRLTEYTYPTQRLRATWASNFVGSIPNFTTKDKWMANVKTMLDRLEEYGLNCLIYHVRTHNNALYKSTLNPKATFVANCDFDEFDPIEYLIDECHKRAIEFHAWMNPYRVLDRYVSGSYPASNPASNPDNLLTNGSGTILNPGLPNVQQFLVDTCMELANNYDIDAIHFDDYFYIDGIDDSATRAIYNTDNLSVEDFRRKQVDTFIEKLSKALRKHYQDTGKLVQLGIAPTGIYRNGGYVASPSYNADGSLKAPLYSNTSGFAHYGSYLYADTLKWINNEWIDYIMPQTYWSIELNVASYASLSRWWSWAVKNRNVNLYLGMGYYMAENNSGGWGANSNEIRDQLLNALMYNEIGGYSLYSYNYLTSSNEIIRRGVNLLKNDYNKVKIPCDEKQYYKDIVPTLSPKNVKVSGNILSFDKVDEARSYIVYKVKNNEALNKDDINQVYYYGTNNSIELDDFMDYTYYVAVVNKANVIGKTYNIDASSSNYQNVIDKIDELPAVITLNDEGKLNLIGDLYDALDDEYKTKVTNYNTYLAKLELFNEKKTNYDAAVAYADLKNYSLERRSEIRTAIQKLTNDINDATTKLEVEQLKANYLAFIDNLPLIDAELSPLKEDAKTRLKQAYDAIDKSYYTSANIRLLYDYYNEGNNDITNAIGKSEITNYLNSALNKLNNVENFKAEYEAKFKLFKEDREASANYYIENDKAVKFYESYYLEQVQNFINAITFRDKEQFLNDETEFIKEVEDNIDALKLELDNLYKKKESISRTIKYSVANCDEQQAIIDKYLNLADKTLSIEALDKLLKDFVDEFNAAAPTPMPSPTPDKDEDSGCNSSTVIINLLSVLSLFSLIFILYKRH